MGYNVRDLCGRIGWYYRCHRSAWSGTLDIFPVGYIPGRIRIMLKLFGSRRILLDFFPSKIVLQISSVECWTLSQSKGVILWFVPVEVRPCWQFSRWCRMYLKEYQFKLFIPPQLRPSGFCLSERRPSQYINILVYVYTAWFSEPRCPLIGHMLCLLPDGQFHWVRLSRSTATRLPWRKCHPRSPKAAFSPPHPVE